MRLGPCTYQFIGAFGFIGRNLSHCQTIRGWALLQAVRKRRKACPGAPFVNVAPPDCVAGATTRRFDCANRPSAVLLCHNREKLRAGISERRDAHEAIIAAFTRGRHWLQAECRNEDRAQCRRCPDALRLLADRQGWCRGRTIHPRAGISDTAASRHPCDAAQGSACRHPAKLSRQWRQARADCLSGGRSTRAIPALVSPLALV